MNKAYRRIEWANDEVPINESNLNRIDVALNEIDDRVVSMDKTLTNQAESMKQAVEAATTAQEAKEIAVEAATQAKTYMENAEAITGVGIATKDRAGLIKGGDNHIAEDGTLMLITPTDQTTMPNSFDGRLLVEEIGGVCEQVSTAGNQLFDIDTVNVGKMILADSGSLYANSAWNTSDLIKVSALTDYCVSQSTTVFFQYKVGFYDADKKFISIISIENSNITKYTFNTLENTGYIRISYSVLVSGNAVDRGNIMVNAGTTALPWEPYTGGIPSPNPSYPQEIKKSVVSEIRAHGKNRFDKSSPWKNSYYSVSGTPTSNTDFTWFSVKTKIGDTFYQSGIVRGSDAVYVCGFKDGVFVKSFIRYTNGAIIVDADVDEIRCSVRASDAETYMLERGSVKTAYEPYVGESVITLSQPIELYKIDDLQDVIEGNQIKRRLKAVTLGIEGWKLSVNGSAYYYATSDGAIKSGSAIISSHFKRGHWNTMGKDEICMGNSQGGMLGISAQSFSSLDELKSFLSNNEVKAVYGLAEKVIEELPLADQIALNSLQTYDGITYLEFDSEIEPTFKGEYGTSKVGGYTLEGMLAGRNGELMGNDYANRITALEATVVNNI